MAAPPHVHPASWAILLASAGLLGWLALGSGRAMEMPAAVGLPTAGLLLLNLAFSHQGLQSARTLGLLAAYALVFLHAACLARGDRGEGAPRAGTAPILVALVACGAAMAIHGLYQALFEFERIAKDQAGDIPEAMLARLASGRAVSTLGLPGALAGFLCLSVPPTAAWAFRRGGALPGRTAAAVLLAIQAAGLLATRSAAATVCLLAALAVVVGRSERSRRPAAVLILAAGVAAAAGLLALRWASPSAVAEGGGPFALRAGNWKVAVEQLADHPLLGTGLGCYGIAFPAYREWGMNETRFAHNTYLQALAEGGLPLGMLLIAAAVALALRIGGGELRAGRPGGAPGRREADAMRNAITVACLAFMFHNVFDFTFFIPSVAFPFFLLAGTAVGAAAPRDAVAPGLRLPARAACIALALFALMLARADGVREQARAAAAEGRRAAAETLAATAVDRNPIDPEAHSLLAGLRLHAALADGAGKDVQLQEAEAAAQRAIRLDPLTPHRWHLLGRIRLARSDPQGAYIALHRAAELYPIQLLYRDDRDAVAAALAVPQAPGR